MITALGPRLGLGLRLDFGSQVWFVQYFSEKKVIVSPGRDNIYGRGAEYLPVLGSKPAKK